MADIVERLRESSSQAGYPKHYIYEEAADEIERFRAEAQRLREALNEVVAMCADHASRASIAAMASEALDAALAKEPGHD